MEWKDVSGLVAKLAPTIATALGGPLAGSGLQALEAAFGINTDGSLEDKKNGLVAAISAASPEHMLAITKANQDYALQMQTAGFKNDEAIAALVVGDRDSARKREMEVKDATPMILAYGITLAFFSIIVSMLFYPMPAPSRDILNVMLGTLGGGWTGVVSYYFGSSVGSAEKTKLLSQADAIK